MAKYRVIRVCGHEDVLGRLNGAVLDESSIIVYTGGPGSKPVTLTDQLMTANGREWRPSREHKP